MSKPKAELVGSFNLTGDTLLAIDPCYSIDDIERLGFESEALAGNYNVFIEYIDEGTWGIRVSNLCVIHADYKYSVHGWRSTSTLVGVDSGQMGIFSKDLFPGRRQDDGPDAFYDACWAAAYDGSIEKDYRNFKFNTLHQIEINMKSVGASDSDIQAVIEKLSKEFTDSAYNAGRRQFKGGIVSDGYTTFGACSSSGLGDGAYRVYVKRNSSDQVIGLRVRFI